jgi:hypothetical protein
MLDRETTIQQKLAAKWRRSFPRASSPAREKIIFLSELSASSEAGGDILIFQDQAN